MKNERSGPPGGPVLAAVLAAAVIWCLPGAASAQYTMKVGLATVNDPQHDLAREFVKRVAENTGGKIKGGVFPSSQLGKIPRQIEGVQLGTQEVYIGPPGFLVGLNPSFQVPVAPGLFDDAEHALRAVRHNPFHDRFLMLAEPKGIIGGNLWIYDGTSIASVEPIRKIEDLRGLKLRVLATKLESAIVGEFGAAGVPMPYTEVLPALQRHTIDGVRSSIVVMGASKFYTVARYITVIGSGYIPSGTWISKAWLNNLPKDLHETVLATAADLEGWVGQKALDYAANAEKLWTDNGGEVIRLSDAEQNEFMERVRGLGDKHLGSDPRTREMYALLKETVKATRNP